MSHPAATPMTARRGLWRWFVAMAATVALVVSGSGLVVFAQSGAGESQGPQFVPADATAYVEVRLDMPGGQDEAVAQMMTAFPGFADAGSFDLKMDEFIAGLGAQMGVAMPEGDLIGDVLTGEMGVALAGLESAMMGEDPAILVGMAAADAAAAGEVVDSLVSQGLEEPMAETYNDVTIYTDPSSSQPMSVAVHGDWVLLGTGGAVQSAIDVLDGDAPSLAEDADFSAAWSRLPAARLGGAWMDFTPFASFIDLAGMMAEGETGMALPTQDLAAMLPEDMLASLVAANDGLTLEVQITPAEQTPPVATGESDLAMTFPADTQLYVETRELGASVGSAMDQLAELMAAQELDTVEGDTGDMSAIDTLFGEESPITAMLGVPLPEFLDFVGDAGVGVGLSGDGLWFGIAAEVTDEAAAEKRMTSLMTFLRMALLQAADEGVGVETADVGGVEVTTINLPLDAMLAESGLPLSVGDSIDVALTGDTLLIGLGDFVESAILSDGSDSLGNSARYTDALGEDTVNAGVMYIDISSLLAALDPMISTMAPEWTELAPYASGLDRMVVINNADDEVISSRMTMYVGQ